MLQREAKVYQHRKQLQYQVLPGVLAAGPTMDGTAYLLATCLLPVVGFSDCLSPSTKHCMLSRPCMVCGYYMVTLEKECIFEAEQICKVTLIDLGHARLCTPESAFQQELLQTQQLFTLGLSKFPRRSLGNVTWYKTV